MKNNVSRMHIIVRNLVVKSRTNIRVTDKHSRRLRTLKGPYMLSKCRHQYSCSNAVTCTAFFSEAQ